MTETELREEKERLIKNDLYSIENRVRHAFNQGYELGRKSVQMTAKWEDYKLAYVDSQSKYNCYIGTCPKCKTMQEADSYCCHCGIRLEVPDETDN